MSWVVAPLLCAKCVSLAGRHVSVGSWLVHGAQALVLCPAPRQPASRPVSLFSTEALSGLWALRSMCSGSGFLHSWVLVFQVCSDVTSLSVFSFLARGQPDLSLFLCSSRHASCPSRLSFVVHFLPQERSAPREDRPCRYSCSAMNPGAGRGPGTYEADN